MAVEFRLLKIVQLKMEVPMRWALSLTLLRDQEDRPQMNKRI